MHMHTHLLSDVLLKYKNPPEVDRNLGIVKTVAKLYCAEAK